MNTETIPFIPEALRLSHEVVELRPTTTSAYLQDGESVDDSGGSCCCCCCCGTGDED